MKINGIVAAALSLAAVFFAAEATCHSQEYPAGLVDKTIATVGGEMILLSDIEEELKIMRAQGYGADKNMRCELLEQMLQSKLFLMQARLDSLVVNNEMVEAQLSQKIDQLKTRLGGEKAAEEYFGKPLYKLRQEWRTALQDQTLTQQEQQKIASDVPAMTPYDVRQYMESLEAEDIPVVPDKYQLSQICVYPDREAAKMAVKERLLHIRERIVKGERFSTMARLYSQDPESARRGGELGWASKSIFWPQFSDVAMSLKPGVVSQIVETPNGFHIIEVLEKKGDMFNARHILLKPDYTSEDREKGFLRLDSLKTKIEAKEISFGAAARFFSEDPATRTNFGQMSDPNTGSSYFEIDQLKPQDYAAISDLKEGEISRPVESLDNELVGNTVYKIIRVDRIIPSHSATIEQDYDVLVEQAKMKKQMEVVEKFIDGKIEKTYVVIDPIFKDCDFSNPKWLSKIVKQ